MKPQLETIDLVGSGKSFRVFRQEYNGFESYWHYHPEIELTYIHYGNGLRFIGDSISPYGTGDICLIGENLPHNYVAANRDPDNNEIAYVIQFPKSIFVNHEEFKPLIRLFNKAKYGLHFPNATEAVYQKILKLNSLSPIKRFNMLIDILDTLNNSKEFKSLSEVSFADTQSMNKQQSRISKVTSYIISHYDKDLSLGQAADLIGMTPSAFSRWFKQSVGKTFVNYLNNIRIERACQQLIQTDLTVKQIAFRSGFDSIGNFNRTFKKYKSETPIIYRKNYDVLNN